MVDKQDPPAAPAPKKSAKQIREQREQEDRDREEDNRLHEKRISWWSKVWIPFVAALAGFGLGLGTCASAYFQRDVRNQVWEATYQDKERVQQKQSDLLKLQEEYLEKLKQLAADEAALRKAQDDLEAAAKAMEKLQQEHQIAMEALRRRYARLEAAEAARLQIEKLSSETKARREKWRAYGCRVDMAYTDCDHGFTVTFAPHTPDEKVITKPSPICTTKQPAWDDVVRDCEIYGRSVLSGKGVPEGDIGPILGAFGAEDAARMLNEVASKPWPDLHSLGQQLRRNNEAADKELKQKFGP